MTSSYLQKLPKLIIFCSLFFLLSLDSELELKCFYLLSCVLGWSLLSWPPHRLPELSPSARSVFVVLTPQIIQLWISQHTFRHAVLEDVRTVALGCSATGEVVWRKKKGSRERNSNPAQRHTSTLLTNHCVKWAWLSVCLFQKFTKISQTSRSWPFVVPSGRTLTQHFSVGGCIEHCSLPSNVFNARHSSFSSVLRNYYSDRHNLFSGVVSEISTGIFSNDTNLLLSMLYVVSLTRSLMVDHCGHRELC